MLDMHLDGSQLHASLQYNSSLFNHSTMERLCEHYNVLLRSIAQQPHDSILQLGFIGEDERQLVSLSDFEHVICVCVSVPWGLLDQHFGHSRCSGYLLHAKCIACSLLEKCQILAFTRQRINCLWPAHPLQNWTHPCISHSDI